MPEWGSTPPSRTQTRGIPLGERPGGRRDPADPAVAVFSAVLAPTCPGNDSATRYSPSPFDGPHPLTPPHGHRDGSLGALPIAGPQEERPCTPDHAQGSGWPPAPLRQPSHWRRSPPAARATTAAAPATTSAPASPAAPTSPPP